MGIGESGQGKGANGGEGEEEGRRPWVWGFSGGVVWGEGGGKRREGGEESCVIKSTAICDARVCFEGGGRCKCKRHGRKCYPYVFARKGVDQMVRGWTAKHEHAGGKCKGCFCAEFEMDWREKGAKKRKGGEGYLEVGKGGEGAGGVEGESDEDFRRFLAEYVL